MDLERLALQLRPRNPWEAMDLGAAMLREWWQPVYGAWFAVYGPAVVLLHLVFTAHPALALLALWWLKPAFDRIVLHVAAGSVFGASPAVRDTVRGYFRYAGRGLFASLTYYRFDLARSFNLPVWQLEGLRGAPARKRAQALHRRARGHAVWLTLICANFELVLFFSLIGLLAMVTPAHAGEQWGWAAFFLGRDDLPLWRVIVEHACYLLAVSIVEPLYVTAGFALYLNRRTQLEAWDVELQLRRLEAAPGRSAPLRQAAAVAVLALVLGWSATPWPVFAAEPPPATPAGEAAREVLKDPAFEQWKDNTGWRYVGPGLGGEESRREPRKSADTDWSGLINGIAELLRLLAWAAGAAAIAWLLWIVARYAGLARGGWREGYRPPDALFGLDLRPESLPDDVPGTAAALMREGRLREALALLYRGALVKLVHVRHVEIAAADTEGDCVRRVSAATPGATAQYFARLVGVWQGAAYANRLPPPADAEALAREWAAAFAPETAPGTATPNGPSA
ncbi:MAG: DUF4129 domain-containing protein [Burkholderiales bacterium]